MTDAQPLPPVRYRHSGATTGAGRRARDTRTCGSSSPSFPMVQLRMARTRNLKPGYFLNERLAELHPLTRILFAGLWCHADREGRLEDRPKKIKAEVLPYDDHDINEALNSLQTAGFILRYRNCERSYIQVLAFLKHQNPHVREPACTIPAPDKPADERLRPRSGKLSSTDQLPGKTATGEAAVSKEDQYQSARKSLKVAEPSSSTGQAPDKNSSGPASNDVPSPNHDVPSPNHDVLDPGGGYIVQRGGVGSTPKRRSRRALPAAPPEGTPGFEKNGLSEIKGLNSAAFAEWDCERRRRGGKSKSSWTDAAKLKAAKLLASESPEDQQAMVDASIAAGWQGLFRPGKGKPKKFNAGEYMLDKVRKRYEKN
jgi:hypothetical protein